MPNSSKVNDPRFRKLWERSGAVNALAVVRWAIPRWENGKALEGGEMFVFSSPVSVCLAERIVERHLANPVDHEGIKEILTNPFVFRDGTPQFQEGVKRGEQARRFRDRAAAAWRK